LASKFQFITELYSRTLTKLTGDYESWTGFLRAACYNYKCPFDEQVLIYAQRPNATAVLELARSKMPVHTKDLAISGHDVLALLEDKSRIREAMRYLLQRVQSTDLPNERSALEAAIIGWQKRH